MEKLYEQFAEVLDVDSVKDSDILLDFEEWDSIAVISLISFVDKEYKVQLYTDDIRAMKTVGDFVRAVEAKKG